MCIQKFIYKEMHIDDDHRSRCAQKSIILLSWDNEVHSGLLIYFQRKEETVVKEYEIYSWFF